MSLNWVIGEKGEEGKDMKQCTDHAKVPAVQTSRSSIMVCGGFRGSGLGSEMLSGNKIKSADNLVFHYIQVITSMDFFFPQMARPYSRSQTVKKLF